MNFSDAMKALQKGERVTRQQWLGSMYFMLEGTDVKSYQPKLNVYNYNEDIMLSDGWEVEGQEGKFMFYDIITFLQQGKKAKLSDWEDSYIKYDASAKYLVSHTMDIFPYQPDFASFTANDWMVL